MFKQVLDPVGGSLGWSTLFAVLPLVTLFVLLGGLDALVFTGGVGERSAPVRAAAAAGLGFLGIALDPERNATAGGDTDIGAEGAAVRTLVVEAREDLEIARQVRAVVCV